MRKIILIIGFTFLLGILGLPQILEMAISSHAYISTTETTAKINFNSDFIDELSAEPLDLTDKDTVIKALFNAKPEGFTVYPSEGYYYFTFTNDGERIKGNFRFDVDEREQGRFSFIYYKELAFAHEGTDDMQYFVLGQDGDGFELVQKNQFEFEIQFQDFRVPVRIYDAAEELAAPKNIAGKEEYIGPIYDESGTRFDLIFDRANDKFLYVLNSLFGYNESYSTIGEDETILIGTRSRFAYFNDRDNDRYVLIGVNLANINENNYYVNKSQTQKWFFLWQFNVDGSESD